MLYTFLLMKDKNLRISLLNQLYGAMLTDRQRQMLVAYYDLDCSLAEIAEECGVSRQAVRDSIKHAEAVLTEFESKFGILRLKEDMAAKLEEIRSLMRNKKYLDEELDRKFEEAERLLEE